jgi:uncharacterized protein involved in exopolysaccharide biosynthesis
MDYQSDRNTGSSPEAQFDLKHFVAIIIRRRLLILAIALPIILVVTLGTLKTSSSVTAGTLIMVEARQPENPVFSQRVVNDDVIMSTAAQIAMSIPVAQLAATMLEDSLEIFRKEDVLLAELAEGNKLVKRLIKSVDCGQIGESNVLHLNFSHPSARFALAGVEALASGFLRYNVERQQNPSAVAYYSDQINSVQTEIDSLLVLSSQVMSQSGLVSFTNAAQNTVLHIRTLEQQLFKARSGRRGIQSRLEQLNRTIQNDGNFIPSDDRFGTMKNTLNQLVSELAELRAKYKDDSVWVQRQLGLISEARQVLKTERKYYISELEIELAEVEGQEEALREAVEEQTKSLVDYPRVQRLLTSYNLQVESRRDLLEGLQFKRGEVRLKASGDQRISNLVMLSGPTINNKIGGSKKILYIGVAFIFAFILGLIIAIFIDNQDHRIYNRRQASQVLDVPVLGTLSSSGKK